MSEAAASPSIRIAFVSVFVIFGGAGLSVAFPEWSVLFADLTQPYHFGDPPHPVAIAFSALGAGVAAVVLFRFLRSGRTSWPLAAVVIASAFACWIWAAVAEPQGRTWATPDRQILNAASAVRERMAQTLQAKGEVPAEPAVWSEALAKSVPWESPVKDRRFRTVPFTIERVEAQDGKPARLVPGTLVVWVSADRARFEITPIGFDKQGVPAPLWDQTGEPLVLRSAFNPDAEH